MSTNKSHLTSAIIAAGIAALTPTTSSAKTLEWEDGVNIQAGFFNPDDKGNIPIGWDLMRKFERIKTVRIEIAPDENVSMATMQRWIREANQSGYKVIATYHRYRDNGSEDERAVQSAAMWWKGNYSELSKAGPFTINMINEWGGHRQTPESFANTYNKAIATVREFYSGPIIVDIPGWGQETYVAAKASSLIKDRNIVYSVHIYSSAYIEQGPHRWMQPEDLMEFAKVDRPVIIGEYGGMREGGADWQALVEQAKALGWTVLAWAWNGDGEGMNMVLPSWNDQYAPEAYYPSTYFGPAYAYIGKTPTPELVLSIQDNITLGDQPSSYQFAIHSNAAWKISVEGGEGWLQSLCPTSGWGTQTVQFRVAKNQTAQRRTAMVTVHCGDIVKTFPIHQNPQGS